MRGRPRQLVGMSGRLVPEEGVEPTQSKAPADFESRGSASPATPGLIETYHSREKHGTEWGLSKCCKVGLRWQSLDWYSLSTTPFELCRRAPNIGLRGLK